jgi:signal transduction histidine kinase
MRKLILLLWLLLIGSVSFSQQAREQKIDSLLNLLKTTKEDIQKVNSLTQLSGQYYYTDSKKNFQYAQKALALAKKIKYEKGIAAAYNNLRHYYLGKADYLQALNCIYKSLHIYENLKDQYGIAQTNNSLGIIYVEFRNYKLSLTCYNKALQISRKLNNNNLTAVYLTNIGDVYLRMNEYRKALIYFEKGIQLDTLKKRSQESGLNYTKIAFTLNFLKQYKKSIEYSNKSISIYNNDSGLFNAYNKLELGKSYYYLSLEEKNSAKRHSLLQTSLKYTNESMVIFKREESLIDIRDAYSYLSKIYKAKGKHQEALSYFEKSTALNDSIFSNENKREMEFLKSKREIDLRDKKIEIKNLKIKSEARKVYLLRTITTAVLLLLGLFFWLFLSKRKTNLQLQDKNKTISNINKQKDKFFSIIAHDLRGPFYGFLGLTELLAEDIDDMEKEEIQFAAVNMRSSANNLNRLLENLLEWSRMEQGLIPFEPTIMHLLPAVTECNSILQDAANNKGITIQTIIDKKTTVFADSNLLQAVIRNILSNAVKFTPKGGVITIQGKEDETNTTIAIKDSGIGMNSKMIENLFQLDVKTNRKGTDDEPSSGLGLILCKEFVEKHAGKIWVESEENKGSTFYFSFPKNKTTAIDISPNGILLAITS